MTFALLRRELLVQGRQPGTYWFRVLMVGVGVLVFVGLWADQTLSVRKGGVGMRQPEMAAWILGVVHGGLMLVLALGGALLTADCLARERREGTLGLLFLTPLGAGDIAVGKCASQLLRLLGFWLSVVPLMTVPLLLGGVTLRNLIDALLAQAAAGLTGVAAGLLATAYGRRWGASVSLALTWLGAFYGSHVIISWAVGFVQVVLIQAKSLDGYFLMMLPAMPLVVGIGLPLEGPTGAGVAAAELAMGRSMLLWMAGWSVLLFVTVMLLLYGVLARVREEDSAPARNPVRSNGSGVAGDSALMGVPTNPVAGKPSVRREARRAGRFPYFSLETRTPLFGWGSGALTAGVSLVWFLRGLSRGNGEGWWFALGYLLPAAILAAAVFMAGASFQRAREEGVLEMLLTTPLTPRALVFGRLGAIARALGPALAMGLFWMGLAMKLKNDQSGFANYVAFVVPAGIAALALAFWSAVRGRGPLVAAGVGFGVGVILPHLVVTLAFTLADWFGKPLGTAFSGQQHLLWNPAVIAYQGAVVLWCVRSALRSFRERASGTPATALAWFTRRS